jgi:hypothetical protein
VTGVGGIALFGELSITSGSSRQLSAGVCDRSVRAAKPGGSATARSSKATGRRRLPLGCIASSRRGDRAPRASHVLASHTPLFRFLAGADLGRAQRALAVNAQRSTRTCCAVVGDGGGPSLAPTALAPFRVWRSTSTRTHVSPSLASTWTLPSKSRGEVAPFTPRQHRVEPPRSARPLWEGMFPSAWGCNLCRRAHRYLTPTLVLRTELALTGRQSQKIRSVGLRPARMERRPGSRGHRSGASRHGRSPWRRRRRLRTLWRTPP